MSGFCHCCGGTERPLTKVGGNSLCTRCIPVLRERANLEHGSPMRLHLVFEGLFSPAKRPRRSHARV